VNNFFGTLVIVLSLYSSGHKDRVNKVLRRIFGPKRDKTVGGCRKFHYGELYKLCSSPNIIRMIKSRRMRRPGHLVCMGEKGNAQTVLVIKLEGKRPL
jgi:hypothetical protein